MAALFAAMAVKEALDNLSSLLLASSTPPAVAGTTRQGLQDLWMLERTMRTIYATLHGAEQHWNLREESAKLQLMELKDLAYDATDVVEEYEFEVNRCRVDGAVCHGGGKRRCQETRIDQQTPVHDDYYSTDEPSTTRVPSELALRARKVVERFTEIKAYYDSFSLSEKDGERRTVPDIRSVRQTSSIVYAPRILGRDHDKESVIEKLMSNSGERISSLGSHMSVLAIVGMGGSGKTTLGQIVYTDSRVRQCFDLQAWVCVSEYFDVENITRKIITSLTRSSCRHIQACDLQGALVEQVKEKSVFLVLDDVWNERRDYWELLCLPLMAARRCDIVVTTRSKAVARLVQTMPFYSLNCLGPADSWSLFKQAAFVEKGIDTPLNLVNIGKSITERCKGLPLAIKTLGSILRYESDEQKWRFVLESEIWNLKQSQNEVLPALELSYKCLPVHLKRCLVSLSLYSKNMYLDEDRVVWLWKLLGLLHSDGSDNEDDEIGSVYFNELVQRSLLQNYIDGERVMHDLVHDLACFLAGDEFFRLDLGKPVIEIPRDARYMSIISEDNKKSAYISNASQSLRAMTMMTDSSDIPIQNPEVLFLNSTKLRIIDVNQDNVSNVLLDFVGGMKLLRHFSLVSNYEDDAVPDSLCRLFNLRTLIIKAQKLTGIGRLVNLQTLPEIHLSRCGCFFNIRELRDMSKIRKLCIQGLCNASIKDANEAHLHTKKNLEVLELKFNALKSCGLHTVSGNQTVSTVSGVQLLESLRPHPRILKVLGLWNFSCEEYPSWLGSTSFSQLTELLLHNCQSQHVPTVGELPALRSLKISGMEQVEHIGREFCSLDPRVKGFPSLVRLILDDMYRLKEWSGVEDGDFPRLEKLVFFSEFEMRSLPAMMSSVPLRYMSLYDCRSLATIPTSATLHELSISECASLNELPAFPSLRSLELIRCPSLNTVGHFPSLTYLHLQAPFKEETLYRLVNTHSSLERLSVWSHTLMSIHLEHQSLPSLGDLELRGSNLQYSNEIGCLTSLKKLNISGSPQFQVPYSLRSQLEKLVTDPV